MGDVLVSQISVDGSRVDRLREVGRASKGFEFAGEIELISMMPIEQWFFAKSISGKDQPILLRIPNGDSKHAIEVLEAIGAEVFVEVNNRFSVAMRTEAVAGPFEAMP